MPLSIVAVGAHIDDQWYGMGGTLLKAARRGHRVTMIQAVSQYGAWPVVNGREGEIKALLDNISKKSGCSLITLGHDYLRLENNPALIGQLAKEITAVEPDLLFVPWEDDSNQDHVAVGAAARIAGMHAPCYLPPGSKIKLPRQIFHYSMDVKSKAFKPDGFVDVSDVMFDLLDLTRCFDELYSQHPLWPDSVKRMTVVDHVEGDRKATLTRQHEYMLSMALLRGMQSGVHYAEGFSAYKGSVASTNLLNDI
jgi:LmbE family N-acetylglucosaminyl deacetylase